MKADDDDAEDNDNDDDEYNNTEKKPYLLAGLKFCQGLLCDL